MSCTSAVLMGQHGMVVERSAVVVGILSNYVQRQAGLFRRRVSYGQVSMFNYEL